MTEPVNLKFTHPDIDISGYVNNLHIKNSRIIKLLVFSFFQPRCRIFQITCSANSRNFNISVQFATIVARFMVMLFDFFRYIQTNQTYLQILKKWIVLIKTITYWSVLVDIEVKLQSDDSTGVHGKIVWNTRHGAVAKWALLAPK